MLIIPSIEGLSLGDNISPQFPLLILTDIIYSCYMGKMCIRDRLSIPTEVIDTQKLGMVRLVEAPFDDRCV